MRRHLPSVLLVVLLCSACGDGGGGGGDETAPRTGTGTPASPQAGASASVTASPTASTLPSGGATPTAVPTTSSSTEALVLAPFGRDGTSVGFASPTGNLTCVLFDEFAECQAQEHTWQAPPEPPECYEVNEDTPDPGDWGRLTVSGEPDGRASFFCGTDPIDPDDNVLQYGQYVRLGLLQCESRSNGLTCRNTGSGHGFTLSRDDVSVF